MAMQLKCKNLILGYDGTCIIQDLNFMVSNGDYLCILGENGSGKSTLMKALLGLNPPMSGEINFCGDTSKNQIGYLPQQTLVQKDFPASVQEIVQSGCISRCGLRFFYNKQEKQLASDMMKKLEIKHLAKSCYRELSGGQQQRVLLARALCSARKMLLLDEPVTGLDAKATHEMYELIANLNQKDNITIIMISHDIQASIKYASHILHIGGKQLFYGSKTEYLTSKVGQAFLSVSGGGANG
ncbi:MAG: ABC transporter ATP-binding protein [Oscillospiraceae bacterium]|nr:ABC transporter ATP-binding protein [Oscillospiraceae bacterium]